MTPREKMLALIESRKAETDAKEKASGLTWREASSLSALRAGRLLGALPETCLAFRERGLIDTRGKLTEAGHKALAVW